ncbi:MAG: hypothetical protein WDM89_22670 [Rhizomicrobium sp.]
MSVAGYDLRINDNRRRKIRARDLRGISEVVDLLCARESLFHLGYKDALGFATTHLDDCTAVFSVRAVSGSRDALLPQESEPGLGARRKPTEGLDAALH